MEALTLLEKAGRAGLEVTVEGERLVVRGPRRAEPLARQVLARKEEMIVLLAPQPATHSGADSGSGDRPVPDRCPACNEGDFVRPHASGAWRCARCRPYDLSGTEVEWWPRVDGPFVSLDVLLGADSPRLGAASCSCCGERRWWRLRATERYSAGPWVCARCHPPLPQPETIEKVRAGLETIGMEAVEGRDE